MADDFGQVKVYRYPVPCKGQTAEIGRGHSSHVTNVKFTGVTNKLLSTGGDD